MTVLLAVYHLFLEREKMHVFNRFYLLLSLVFSFTVPQLIIEVAPKPTAAEDVVPLQDTTISGGVEVTENVALTASDIIADNAMAILISIYAIGFLLFLYRLVKNLYEIYKKAVENEKVRSQNAFFVLLREKILPHSFLHYIFINRADFAHKKIEEELYTHELTHVKQKHSLDILFIEFLKVIFWFNPIIYLFKKAIQLNHEFLADESVVSAHKNVSAYQHLLLDKAEWKNKVYLASNLNYLVTKKRLKMMTKRTPALVGAIKKISLIPLLAILVYSFSTKVEAQVEVTDKQDPKAEQTAKTDEAFTIAEDLDIEIKADLRITLNQKPVEKDLFRQELKKINSHLSQEEKKKLIHAKIKLEGDVKMGVITDVTDAITQDGAKKISYYIKTDKGLSLAKQLLGSDINPPQEVATEKMIKEYNDYVRKLNAQPENKRIIKLKDLTRIKYIYNLMTPAQREKAEKFPKLPPPPPPPPAPKAKKVPEPPKVIKIKEVKPPSKPEEPKLIIKEKPRVIEVQKDGKKPVVVYEIIDKKNAEEAIKVELVKIGEKQRKEYMERSRAYTRKIKEYLAKGDKKTHDELVKDYHEVKEIYNAFDERVRKSFGLRPPPPPPPVKPKQMAELDQELKRAVEVYLDNMNVYFKKLKKLKSSTKLSESDSKELLREYSKLSKIYHALDAKKIKQINLQLPPPPLEQELN
ncbi:M56 family metallopeptidase [Leptobacterium flavescens]|uniref:M56 family metallopeptidase n=1 Tax=Leptobacterium flavescens TaxID=472055 RepID=UPI0019530FA8|nr:M56 family metallopeptidase [Leptobacterium flavescens]